MERITINAIGEACPIPVVKTMKALEALTAPAALEVHVDNEVAVQNLQRLADSKGLHAELHKQDDRHFIVVMEAGQPISFADADAPACTPAQPRGNTVVAVSSACMGTGNDELGKLLMKGFLYAVSQLDPLPAAILFYNGGAHITTEASPSLEDLRNMEAQGVKIMTCGTCLDFYGLKDKLAVGSVTNMYQIVETLAGAANVIRP